MKKTLKLKALAIAALAVAGASSVMAQFTNNADIDIIANNDNSGGGEGVFIRSNQGAAAGANFVTNGDADVFGSVTTVRGSTTATMSSGSNASVSTVGSGTHANSVFIKGSEEVNINASNINGNVNIGNGNANNTINGVTNTVTGTTNNITGTTNNITGTTNINASNNAATNINTGTSTGNVTVGNAANVTNINSGTNNMGAGYASINNIGTGAAAATTNNIGNTNAGTKVTSTAGNASQALSNNIATTNVTGGTSGLSNPTGGTSSQVRISNSGGATVDANGKLAVSGASSATAGLTVTNGYGNVNGVVATERQASISGGTTTASASTLSMNDNGARFSNAATGAPVTVTGVADGKNDFDAINVRQFAGAIAAVAAQANVPALAAGQERTFGVGVGSFMGKTGLALGMNFRDTDNTNAVYKLSVSTGLNGGAKTVIGAGAAWSF